MAYLIFSQNGFTAKICANDEEKNNLVLPNPDPANRILVEVVDGRNREVRVLCADAGVDVKNLKRTRVGGLRMPKELPLGKYVRLKPNQVAHVLDKGLALNGGTF